jgi:hypothetical protein
MEMVAGQPRIFAAFYGLDWEGDLDLSYTRVT